MPIGNQQFADVVDTLFDKVLETEIWWNKASIRAAWLGGLHYALADGHPNNRSWLSAHGKIFVDLLNHVLIVNLKCITVRRTINENKMESRSVQDYLLILIGHVCVYIFCIGPT